MWFIRGVLKVKPTTCTIITIGEAGIIPPSIKCHISVILNFIRLKCMTKGPVVKSVFDDLESQHNVGISCWYSKVLELAKSYDIDPLTYDFSEATKNKIKASIKSQYVRNWMSDMHKFPILRMYKTIKCKFGYEQYLSLIKNNKYRIAMSRFRASSHTLEIERGRYTIPTTAIENRICCICDKIEDEKHFLLKCQLYIDNRNSLFSKISEIFPEFLSFQDDEKFVFLLNNMDPQILTWVGKYIYESFCQRTEYHAES